MKKIFAGIIAVGMAFALTACGGSDSSAKSASASSAKTEDASVQADTGDLTIAYSAGDLNLVFDNLLYEAAEAKCKELGVGFVGQDAQADNMLQVDQINALIAQEVDGIVVNLVTTDSAKAVSDICQEAGVPLVFCNMFPWGEADEANIPDGCYYIGSVEDDAGRIQAKHALEKFGDSEFSYCILEGPLGSSGQLGRTNGNHEILDTADNAKFIDEQTANWLRDEGYTMTQNWISAYGDSLNVVFANNDEMALGAVKASKEAGKDIVVYGVDATTDGLQAVIDGDMEATVLQDAKGQAGTAVEVVYQIIKDGSAEKCTWIPFVLVTAEDAPSYLQ